MGQTLTVEYAVTDALDGTTPAPPIDISSPAGLSPEDQIFRRDVENLGIIDPDLVFSGAGSFGARFVPFLWIDTTELGAAGARLAVMGVRADGTMVLQQEVEDLVGDPGVYHSSGIVIPQGSVLQVTGFTAAPGVPINVRMTVMTISTVTEMADAIFVASS